MKNKKVFLKKGREKPVLFCHPWVFSGAIDTKEEGLEKGDFADVYSHDRKYLASGFYNPSSDIALRLFEFEQGNKNPSDIIDNLLSQAIILRSSFMDFSATTTFRLVHAEGDYLPGLICDLYGSVIALQFNSAGLYFIRDFILKRLIFYIKEHLNIEVSCAVDKTSDKTLKLEGIEAGDRILFGETDGKLFAKENNFTFALDIFQGQKTGFYSDQRENRKVIASCIKGLSGYDLFCYSGGFSVYLGKENNLTCVDSSASATELLKENLCLNKISADVVCGDVYKYLNNIEETDFINADPPKYIFRDKDFKRGLKQYGLLYTLCLSKIRRGGYLGASSCSGLLGMDDFLSVISKSAIKAGKKLMLIYSSHGGYDYPVSMSCPESAYLKFALFRVV